MSESSLCYSPPSVIHISPIAVTTVALAHLVIGALLLALDVLPLPQSLPTLTVQVLPAQTKTSDLLPEPKVQPPAKRQQPAPQARPAPTLAATESAAANTLPVAAAPVTPAPPAPAKAEISVSAPRFDVDYLDNPAPVYPALAKRMGEEGKVMLRVHVEANGQPSRIEIRNSSGSPRLDQAAEQAVWRWKFVPAKRGNDAVAAWVVVPISFNLRG